MPPEAPAKKSVTRIVGGLAFIELTSGLVQGFVISLTPAIGVKLHIHAGQLTWISIIQLLATALCVPIFARLGDVFGHRRMLRVAVISLALGSVLVAIAPSWGLLLVGRFLQGSLGSLLPLEFALLRNRLKGGMVTTAVGRLVAMLTLGVSAGLVFAGSIRKSVDDPQHVLLVPALLTVLCIGVVYLFVPESAIRERHNLDIPGMALFAVGLGSALVGIAQGPTWGWTAAWTLICLLGGVVVLAAFVVVELRSPQPAIDIRFVIRRDMAPLYVGALLIGTSLFGAQTAASTFLATPKAVGYGFGLTTLSLSVVLLCASAAPCFTGANIAGPLVARGYGRTIVAGGFAIGALGYTLLAIANGQLWHWIIGSTITGFGTGLVTGGLPGLIVDRAPAAGTGSASGVYQVGRNVGGSIAGATFAAVLSNHTIAQSSVPTVRGYEDVWLSCAVLLAGGGAAAWAFGRRHVTAPTEQPGGGRVAGVDRDDNHSLSVSTAVARD